MCQFMCGGLRTSVSIGDSARFLYAGLHVCMMDFMRDLCIRVRQCIVGM